MNRSELNLDPRKQFLKWYQDAEKSGTKNPDAMVLATATSRGVPSARVVLYKGFNKKGLRFFTNYLSRKGQELSTNPKGALVFYWSALDRQVRLEGKIEKLSVKESDAYWKTRPRESQIGALASKQSSPLANRSELEKRIRELEGKFQNREVPRPVNWGGYCLVPNRFEFWIAGDYRIHDRFSYIKKGSQWRIQRLAP